MDKVKHFLEVARKHHFWILCGIAALAALLAWMMSTNELAAQFKTRKGDIDGQLSALTGITAPHPNETWSTGMQQTTADARESVRAAWTLLYQDQKEKIFNWPTALQKDFLDDIAKVEDGKKLDLRQNLRERYQNRVDGFAKELPKIVDAAVIEDQIMGANAAPMNPMVDQFGDPIIIDYRVIWDQQSQQEIFDTFTWEERPTTTIVRQAQEELWVYDALCKVIAEVNKDSKGSHDAPITAIQQMAVAYLAQDGGSGMGMGMGNTGRIMRVKSGTAGTGGEEAMMGRGMPMAMPGGESTTAAGAPPDPKQRCKGEGAGGFGGRGGPLGMVPGADPAAAGGAAADPDEMWKGWRYVGEDGKPLMTGAEVESSPLEYNLMPFRVKLMINPKEIDRLLVSCRNSALPLQVKEVRVGDTLSTGGGSVGGGGFSRMPMMRGRGGFEGEMGPMMRTPTMAPGTEGIPQQKTIQIELNGVAYLMKKPDPTKLGITPPDGTVPADGTMPPTGDTAPAPPMAMNVNQRESIALTASRRGRRV